MTQHFKFPFTIDTASGAATVEENTGDEILQCVQVALLTPAGSSLDVPAFGVPEVLFTSEPDVSMIASQVERFEPRVRIRVERAYRTYQEFLADMRVNVEIIGASNGQ